MTMTPELAEMAQTALEQQQAYQKRIDNQRAIIERYDGYRRWVLAEVVPAMEAWAAELAAASQDVAAAEIQTMATRTKLMGENLPKETR